MATDLTRVDLGVQWIRQEDAIRYCGAACIQMILRSKGILRAQSDIWDDTRLLLDPASTNVWYTDPRAIASYLDAVPEVAASVRILDVLAGDFTFAVSKIVRNIVAYEIPSAILVRNGAHWVVVAGVQCAFEDQDRENGRVSGLWIADPLSAQRTLEFRPLNVFFEDQWFTPSNVRNDQLWTGKRVVVGERSDDIVDQLEFVQPPTGGGGLALTDVGDIINAVVVDLQLSGFGTAEPLLGGGGELLEPLRITNLSTGEPYFIVPTIIGGRLAWSAYLPAFEGITYNSIASTILANSLNLPKTGAELNFLVNRSCGARKPLRFSEKPGLFWKPSVELPSPFDLVRVVEISSKQLYVTASGRIHTDLHETTDQEFLGG